MPVVVNALLELEDIHLRKRGLAGTSGTLEEGLCMGRSSGARVKKGRKSQRSMEKWEIRVGWENAQ